MTLGDVIIIAILLVLIGFSVHSIRKTKKSGGCTGNCACCGKCSGKCSENCSAHK